MPSYNFRCRNCEHVFTALAASRGVAADHLICPNCRSSRAEEILESAPVGDFAAPASLDISQFPATFSAYY